MLGFACLMPDCWPDVSSHSEGPATGQLDQGFAWLSSVLEKMLSWCPNSTLHCSLHMQPLQCQIKFHHNAALPTSYKKLIPIICITSIRRKNGHCLGAFKTGDIISFLTKIVSLTTSLFLSLLPPQPDNAV
jgi:hypothetical protein